MGVGDIKVKIKDVEGKKAKLVELTGTLDVLSPPDLEQKVPPLIEEGCDIIIDCTHLDYVNSRGLVSFLDFSGKAQKKGIKFIVANPNKPVYETMDISGAIKLLEVLDTVEAAIEKVR